MLVLGREKGERVLIGDNIWVTVLKTGSGGVKLGIEAPSEVRILRGELVRKDDTRNQAVSYTHLTLPTIYSV